MVWERLYRFYEIPMPGGYPAPDAPGFNFGGFSEEARETFLRRVGADFRGVGPQYVGPPEKINEDGSWVDMWGTTYKWIPFHDSYYETAVGHPLAEIGSLEKLEDYPFPTMDWFDFSAIPEQCRRYADYALISGGPGCMDFINGISFGRGVERVLMDIAEEDPVYLHIVEKRFDFFYAQVKMTLEAAQGALDVVYVGEDLGTQLGPIISPSAFEKLFGRYYRKIFALAHEYGANTMMHSCGSVRKFIPMLIDMGLDILDVVHVDAKDMDLAGLHRDFYGKIMFSGTLSVQSLLPHATPTQIRETIRNERKLFHDGGLILGPTNVMQVDMPTENFDAMVRAITEID